MQNLSEKANSIGGPFNTPAKMRLLNASDTPENRTYYSKAIRIQNLSANIAKPQWYDKAYHIGNSYKTLAEIRLFNARQTPDKTRM